MALLERSASQIFDRAWLEMLAFEQPETSRILIKNRCIELMESLS